MGKSGSKRGANPPRGLSPASRRLWVEFTSAWTINVEGRELLRLGLLARDRMEAASAILRRDGLTTVVRGGSVRPHPAVKILNAERAAYVAALRALGLEGG